MEIDDKVSDGVDNDPGDNLRKVMSTISVDPDIIQAMSELCYTASERGIIPFDLRGDEDFDSIVKLVRLAERYQTNVPDSLRM